MLWPAWILGTAGLIALLAHPRTRRDPALLVLCALLVAPLALSYAWIVHLPLDYQRMGYYVALPLVAAAGAAAGMLVPRPAFALALVPLVLVASRAHELALGYRTFYQLANGTTLQGLSYLQQRAGSSKAPVVTDQCWAFLAPWLLQRPTLAALENWEIAVKQELAPAEKARRMLYGGAPGQELARRMGIRYVLLDPTCLSRHARPPTIAGRPIFASTRLLILELPRSSPSTMP